jgi:hypothetical protein
MMLLRLFSYGGNLLFKVDVYIVKIEPGLFPKIKGAMVEDSQRRIKDLRACLNDRTEVTASVPCALEGISSISLEDDCFRLIQLLRRHDGKRVKEIVRQKIQRYLKTHPEFLSVPKAVAKQIAAEVKQDEIEDQVPKIIEMLLMFYSDDVLMHSSSNITLFKPYILDVAEQPIIFFSAFAGIDPDSWETTLTESECGVIDGPKFILKQPINQCDVTLYPGSNNRIKLSSRRQLTPSIVYETWAQTVKLIKDNQT